jgi:putative SOS response-associated peptidase YedK
MCGRFSLKAADLQRLAKRFDAKPRVGASLVVAPRYNIAPSQQILAVKADGAQRELCLMKWGLIPSWAKDPAIGFKMTNARAETVREKPSYRGPFRSRRCLVPCDAFYEWKTLPDGKQPFAFSLADDSVFALAALWDSWTDPSSKETIESVSLITTTPNDVVSAVHDRMPVILHEADEATWLHGAPDDAARLMKPYDGPMKTWQVSRRLNVARTDDASLLHPEPSTDASTQFRLEH